MFRTCFAAEELLIRCFLFFNQLNPAIPLHHGKYIADILVLFCIEYGNLKARHKTCLAAIDSFDIAIGNGKVIYSEGAAKYKTLLGK